MDNHLFYHQLSARAYVHGRSQKTSILQDGSSWCQRQFMHIPCTVLTQVNISWVIHLVSSQEYNFCHCRWGVYFSHQVKE